MIECRNLSRHLVVSATLVFSFVAAGCGSAASIVAPSATAATAASSSPVPVPATTLTTISGRVTETVPTTVVGIEGATVTVSDGPSAITDFFGFYSIKRLKSGPFTISVTADRYVQASQDHDVTTDATFNFQLMPVMETKAYTFSDHIDPKGGTCSDGVAQKPCLIYAFPVHNAGPLEATLSWTPGADTDLDLTLFQTRMPDPLARASSSGDKRKHLTATLTTGASYELRVTYKSGTAPAPVAYTLSFSQPS